MRADARRSRQALVDAAQQVLAEDPGASVDELAAAACVGRTTAFRHFRTREELVGEAWRATAASAIRELDQTDLESAEPDDLLDGLVAAMVRTGERHPLLVHGPRPSSGELVDLFAATDAKLRRAVEHAQARGALRDDLAPVVIVEHLLATAQAVLVAGLSGEDAVRAAQSLAGQGASSRPRRRRRPRRSAHQPAGH